MPAFLSNPLFEFALNPNAWRLNKNFNYVLPIPVSELETFLAIFDDYSFKIRENFKKYHKVSTGGAFVLREYNDPHYDFAYLIYKLNN
jgi:hypothetical protein